MKTRPPARRRSPCHADLPWLIEAGADEFDRVISRSKLPVLVSARLGVQGIPTMGSLPTARRSPVRWVRCPPTASAAGSTERSTSSGELEEHLLHVGHVVAGFSRP